MARSLLARTLPGLIVLLSVLGTPTQAEARRENSYHYRFEQVWGASVRLIRVDYGFRIQDQDRDVGYLLFEYRDGERTYPGSIELVPTQQDGRDAVRVVLTVPAMPSYVERMLLDRLSRKLVLDYGDPLPPPAPPRVIEREEEDDEDGDTDESEVDDEAMERRRRRR